MQINITKQINYFNEALLLATYICNTLEDSDLNLPIDYKKIALSKEQIDKENEEFVNFLSAIRFEARKKLKEFSGIEILFQRLTHKDNLEPLYFLTYAKLESSIQSYSAKTLLDRIKEDFVNNINSIGYPITPDFRFEAIDQLRFFNEQQRYMIYKLLHNINQTFDDFYQFIQSLEKIIKKHESIIAKQIQKQYADLKTRDVLKIDDTGTLVSTIKNTAIKSVNYTFFIQFSQLFGYSLFSDNDKKDIKGFVFFGVLPYALRNKPKSIEERKADMITKFALLSDTTRFNIVILLASGAMYGREIAEKLSISTGTISHHLSNLLKEGIILSEVKGKRIYYSINPLEVNRMSQFLKQLGGDINDE